ncbi:MAG: hypothetical protein CTY15_12505 [Methylocystis sp.]|nr:MAG: hypothetical protein CTY15_12505 [Methylocystis sp.]
MLPRNTAKGMAAGFVATVILSILMMVKSRMGLMPELDVIAMLTGMMAAPTPLAGWIGHFAIGAILWGGLFAWLDPSLPGSSHWLKGAYFGIGAWILMMVLVMPMAGAGFFGLSLGVMAPIMTLVLHLVFGAALGGVYGLERPESEFEYSRRL